MSDDEAWRGEPEQSPPQSIFSSFWGKPMTKEERAAYDAKVKDDAAQRLALAELRAVMLTSYRPNVTCVKCGGTSVRVRFCPEVKDAARAPLCFDHTAGREHLHRTCKGCRFVWYELPLDAER